MIVKELVIFRWKYNTYLSVFFITFDINFDVLTPSIIYYGYTSEFSHELCDFSILVVVFMLEETY